MATNDAAAQLTLLELARRMENGKLLTIARNLSQRNRMMEDAVWVEANQTTTHKTVRHTTEPTGTYRDLNDGVPRESNTTDTISDVIGMLETYNRTDASILALSKDPAGMRFQEDMGTLGGMSKTVAESIIYGSLADNSSEFDGLAVRFNSLARDNGHDEGGTGSDVMSIWIVRWSDFDGVHLIYPRDDSNIGISIRDLGEDTVGGATASTEFQAFRTHFKIDLGLVVRDTRSVQRVANIESDGSSNIFDPDTLITSLNQMWELDNTVIYCNRTAKTQIDINAKDKTNAYYTVDNVFGKPTTMFQGIPIKLVEQLTITETAVA